MLPNNYIQLYHKEKAYLIKKVCLIYYSGSVKIGLPKTSVVTKSKIHKMDQPNTAHKIPTTRSPTLFFSAPFTMRYIAQIKSNPGKQKMILTMSGRSSIHSTNFILKKPPMIYIYYINIYLKLQFINKKL